MLHSRRVIAVVPARAGSKGLVGKNTLPLAGRPLVAWTIAAGIESLTVDDVIVTSDDPDVLAIASDLGACPVARPAELSTDAALMSDVIRHVLAQHEQADVVVLLQPTSPLRTASDIDGALASLKDADDEAVVSVYQPRVAPELMYRSDMDGHLVPLLQTRESRRQDWPAVYLLNGALFAASKRALAEADFHFGSMKMIPYVMRPEASIDIDDRADFDEAQRILLEQRHRHQ